MTTSALLSLSLAGGFTGELHLLPGMEDARSAVRNQTQKCPHGNTVIVAFERTSGRKLKPTIACANDILGVERDDRGVYLRVQGSSSANVAERQMYITVDPGTDLEIVRGLLQGMQNDGRRLVFGTIDSALQLLDCGNVLPTEKVRRDRKTPDPDRLLDKAHLVYRD